MPGAFPGRGSRARDAAGSAHAHRAGPGAGPVVGTVDGIHTEKTVDFA
ncbi:hypothetical protein [Nocardiopsis sp. CC223A]|nr:hypothetical protein [Nocardiopsis sp. CC223A]